MSAYILNIVKGVTTYEQRDGTVWVGSADAIVDRISSHTWPNAILVKDGPESIAIARAALMSELNSFIYNRSGSKATVLNCLPSNHWTVISDAMIELQLDFKVNQYVQFICKQLNLSREAVNSLVIRTTTKLIEVGALTAITQRVGDELVIHRTTMEDIGDWWPSLSDRQLNCLTNSDTYDVDMVKELYNVLAIVSNNKRIHLRGISRLPVDHPDLKQIIAGVVTSYSVDYLNSLLNFNITDYIKQSIG